MRALIRIHLFLFTDINDSLSAGHANFQALDIQAAVDPSTVFIEAELDAFNSPVFDQF